MRNGARSKTISNVKKSVQRNVNVALSPFVFRHARPPDPETDEGTFQTRRFEHQVEGEEAAGIEDEDFFSRMDSI